MTDPVEVAEVMWVVSQSALLWLLQRAHDGEDPEMIYTEVYANFLVTGDDE